MSSFEQGLWEYVTMLAQHAPGLQPGWTFRSYNDILLQHGRFFPLAAPTAQPKRMTPKQCYSNCFRLIGSSRPLTYCEGYVLPGWTGFPIEHAWLLNAEGQVLEPTLKHDGICVYFGVPFETRFVMRTIARSEHYSVLFNDWLRDHRLLRAGLPVDALSPLLEKGRKPDGIFA